MSSVDGQYRYRDSSGIIQMFRERDIPPFDYFTMGIFKKNDDGYYYFLPYDGVQMTCKDLRTAAQKAIDLNS